MSTIEQVRPLVESKVIELGFELFDLRFFGAGSRSIMRITIDSERHISISDCELVSGAIGALLDEQNFFGDKQYTLEVSSPGIDRPLKTERDFRRVTGKNVMLNLSEAVNGKKCVRGKVIEYKDGILEIEIDKNITKVPLVNIFSGKEEIRFR
ncbi:MAG: ribosome maturation factor RimP [Chitinispirillales bacterium]|jgi:ribosome maturation factor RimP|nr:ribosome maturation factor RimP [Chitinispirillales bacterium]